MKNIWQIQKAASQFNSCKYMSDLAVLLKEPKSALTLQVLAAEYYEFTMPKKDGSERRIEAPYPALKRILRKLNEYLQCVYVLQKPSAAYGYVISYKGNGQPCNILTNAERHLNANYMVNIDFEDFFHQVTIADVQHIFHSAPFHFTKKSAELLASLCCYKDRLPMGSPTSPVLSNFHTQALDEELITWAFLHEITYTRFVDDLTFSSGLPISGEHLEQIRGICERHRFRLNPAKTRRFGPADIKVVTGLEVSDKVALPGKFYYELSQDIRRLEHTIEASTMIKGEKRTGFVKEFQQQVLGKVNFIGMILGEGSEKYQKYYGEYDHAINPDIDKLSMRWTDFPYNFD